MWEDLPSDGASYRCSVEVYVEDYWRCRREAITAITDEARKALKLPLKIKLAGRAVCGIHQNTIEDYINRV